MTVKELERQAVKALVAYNGDEREAQAMVRLLFEVVKGWRPVDVAVRGGDLASDYVIDRVTEAVDRVCGGEPIQYVLGVARFMGMDFEVTPATLIPRPETQELVDMVVREADGRADLRVLDIGTGTGCIAIALARALRFAQVTAIDISAAAIEVARRNGDRYRTHIAWAVADMLQMQPQTDAYDIIVSNPPYIMPDEQAEMARHVLDHEPHSALFAPEGDPLYYYRAIWTYALTALAPGGRLYLEINPRCADALRQALTTAGFRDVEAHRDMYGKLRFITATR